MAFLMNKKKWAAVSRGTPENTKDNQSQNTLGPELAREYISQVSEAIEGRVTKKFSWTESCILGALSKLDEFLLNPQVRTCSVAVPGTSRNSTPENREPTGGRSLDDPCPDARFSSHHSGNLNNSEGKTIFTPMMKTYNSREFLIYFIIPSWENMQLLQNYCKNFCKILQENALTWANSCKIFARVVLFCKSWVFFVKFLREFCVLCKIFARVVISLDESLSLSFYYRTKSACIRLR